MWSRTRLSEDCTVVPSARPPVTLIGQAARMFGIGARGDVNIRSAGFDFREVAEKSEHAAFPCEPVRLGFRLVPCQSGRQSENRHGRANRPPPQAGWQVARSLDATDAMLA